MKQSRRVKIHDRVYGGIEITEPLIVDLLQTKSLTRLKDVDQGGYSKIFYPGTEQDRFEHSVGVCHLLGRYGAPLSEQAAGLLHDVSHSAFSHSIDYIVGKTEKDQSHQDAIFQEFVRRSDIPPVLANHGIPLDAVIRLDRYPLLDHELPDLSADRIDYSLRTAVAFSWISQKEAMRYIDNLSTNDSHWVFSDYSVARQYAALFYKLNKELYSGPTSAVMFRTVGDCIGYAVKRGYVSHDDLYTTDAEVLAKVRRHLASDTHLTLLWRRMNKKTHFTFTRKNANAHVFCKSRIVDPLCTVQGKTVRVSDIDGSWKQTVSQELRPKEYSIRFFDTNS